MQLRSVGAAEFVSFGAQLASQALASRCGHLGHEAGAGQMAVGKWRSTQKYASFFFSLVNWPPYAIRGLTHWWWIAGVASPLSRASRASGALGSFQHSNEER